MTLTQCPVCGGTVSAEASTCPHCGHPLRSPASIPLRPTGPTRGTTTAVRAFFLIGGGATLASAVAGWDYVRKIGDWINVSGPANTDAVVEAEDLFLTMMGLAVIAGLVLGILLMVWGNKAYHEVLARGASGGRWSPGWAVGGWFIPLANLVIPKLVLNDIDRMSHPENMRPVGEGWRERSVASAGTWWWVLSVGGFVLGAIGSGMRGDAIEPILLADWDAYQRGTVFLTAALVSGGIGQFFGAAYIKALAPRFFPSGS